MRRRVRRSLSNNHGTFEKISYSFQKVRLGNHAKDREPIKSRFLPCNLICLVLKIFTLIFKLLHPPEKEKENKYHDLKRTVSHVIFQKTTFETCTKIRFRIFHTGFSIPYCLKEVCPLFGMRREGGVL